MIRSIVRCAGPPFFKSPADRRRAQWKALTRRARRGRNAEAFLNPLLTSREERKDLFCRLRGQFARLPENILPVICISGNQVNVEMKYGLPCRRLIILDNIKAVAVHRTGHLNGDFLRQHRRLHEKILRDLVQIRIVLLRKDQRITRKSSSSYKVAVGISPPASLQKIQSDMTSSLIIYSDPFRIRTCN